MATQYTAGLTTGQVLTSATMNSIGAAWETWTPTVTATAGTITSGATTLARYMRIQKLVIVDFNFYIATAGTAAGASLITTIPVPALASYAIGNAVGYGREYVAVGYALQGLLITNTIRISTPAPAGWITSNHGCSMTFIYEAA